MWQCISEALLVYQSQNPLIWISSQDCDSPTSQYTDQGVKITKPKDLANLDRDPAGPQEGMAAGT